MKEVKARHSRRGPLNKKTAIAEAMNKAMADLKRKKRSDLGHGTHQQPHLAPKVHR